MCKLYQINLYLILLLLPLTSCQLAPKRQIVSDLVIIPFAFHEETKDWLTECEFQMKPPEQAIFDFDALAKHQERIRLYNERLED